MTKQYDLHAAVGTWSGTSRLMMHEEPDRECASTAEVDTVAQGKFTVIRYTWEFEGTPQDGLLLIGINTAHDAQATFVDSWHLGELAIVLRGTARDDGSLELRGTYSVPDNPDWGWGVLVEGSSSALVVSDD